ncbi:hypothetical protein [Photobacterium sanctipauli]|nr:hypothetical protein [Photobacterium sanctipauli]
MGLNQSQLTPEQRIKQLEQQLFDTQQALIKTRQQLFQANQKAEFFEAVIEVLKQDGGFYIVKEHSDPST